MELTVKLESCEGPRDFLFELMEKKKIKNYYKPLLEITKQ